jgi:hypothetical protein
MRTKTDKIIRINNNICSVDVTDEDQTHNIRNTLIWNLGETRGYGMDKLSALSEFCSKF